MFSTSARFDGSRVGVRTTTIKRSNASLTRRPRGRAISAAAPRRLRLRCTLESDLTQNAPSDPTLLEAQEETAEEQTPQEPTLNEALQPGPVLQSTPSDEKDDAFMLTRRDLKRSDMMKSQEILLNLKLKQQVIIHVTKVQGLGASVELLDHRPCQAFLPIAFFPIELQPTVPKKGLVYPPQKRIEYGIKRKAVIHSLNPDYKDFKGGVVVSAWHQDREILFRRLIQLRNLCAEGGQSIKGYVVARVFRGMLVIVAGFTCFLPADHYGKQAREINRATKMEFSTHYKNAEIDVVVKDVERLRDRVVVSNLVAENIGALRTLRIGSLIHGRIVNIKPYGVFVTLNDTTRTGLLHVRNISKVHVNEPDEVFEIGEKIYALVLDIDPITQRYALSTADLEEERGEIMYNKDLVMENAPAMAAHLQKELENAREAHLSENHVED